MAVMEGIPVARVPQDRQEAVGTVVLQDQLAARAILAEVFLQRVALRGRAARLGRAVHRVRRSQSKNTAASITAARQSPVFPESVARSRLNSVTQLAALPVTGPVHLTLPVFRVTRLLYPPPLSVSNIRGSALLLPVYLPVEAVEIIPMHHPYKAGHHHVFPMIIVATVRRLPSPVIQHRPLLPGRHHVCPMHHRQLLVDSVMEPNV